MEANSSSGERPLDGSKKSKLQQLRQTPNGNSDVAEIHSTLCHMTVNTNRLWNSHTICNSDIQVLQTNLITSTSVFRDWRISTHADPMSTRRKLDRHVSHKSLEASHYNKGELADSSNFGLLWSKVHKIFHKNGRFPALDADEPPCKIWRR